MSVFEKAADKADAEKDELNAQLAEIPAETRRSQAGWRQGGVPMERSKDFGNAIRRLGQLLRPDYPALALIVVMALGSTILNVMGPKILGRATDVVIDGFRTGGGTDFGKLHHILFEAGEVYLGGAVLGVGIAYVLAGVVQRLMYRLREQAEEKVHSLPLSYIDQQARGDLLSRVTNDLDNVAQTMQQTLSQMLTSVLLLVGVAVMMFTISPFLAPIALITVPAALVTMRVIGKRARPKFIEQWRSTGELNAQIEETFTGHSIVKAFGRQHEVEARFEETNEVLFQSSFGAQFMSSLMQPATMFLSNVQYVIVAVVGGLRVATGAISIGDVQAFIQYSRQFAMPLTQLASMMNVFQSGIASLERVLELLDADDQVPDRDNELPEPVQGRVVFDDVCFSYNKDRSLIEGLELVAEPGQTIAIVGPTGAGKTTLVNLIMRFYELDAGFITLDGVDIASIPRSDLRDQLGMVLQDTWLFGGTIRDNIAYGKPDATEEQILEAAKACYVDRFVHNLPDGYDTVINEEGDNISAGQKQLITIARAFLADRSILILDEATSSVDTRTEVQVQVAMNRLRKNRTSFVIAHRLSTIRGADTILVMQNGQIVEQGSHEELLSRDGPYFRLYNSQFAGAVTESDPNALQS